ncbi:Ti-type conjugative transfer relaxase TraA [Azospirillum fermentarium]|uniref:AAA family ATPase n=1 Tax=Azospirillum fermentarium TaxID=1233114 RepID=UPI0022276B20|nr:AAA family ATPase [Azospirillum fermentarium]MCW2247862.1 Ti-type conjugative transfer relaxase TraA [Azospirillum fermentarium]
MAIEFARIRYVKRSEGGNACRSAAYNARSDVRCQRTGERFFFAHRDGVLHHEMLLPEGADARFADPEVLWNAAQAAEKRKDAQEARELLLALPCNPELGLDDCRTLAAEFAAAHFVSKGVAVQLDIHAPHEGDTNIHAHLLITTRRIEGAALSSAKARDLDPEVRRLKNGKAAVTEAERWGVAWREAQNLYFERMGLDIRVDETGIVPQRHEGPVRLRTVPKAAEARAVRTAADNALAARDPAEIVATLTRRQATFTELDIERLIRKHVADAGERQAIRAAVLARPEIVPLHARSSGEFAGRYTTVQVRAEERQVAADAASIGVAREAVAARHVRAAAEARTLDAEQRDAFLKATGTDGLVVIEGLAGTGKSYSIDAIRDAHERAGWRVIGLAPTNTVADDLRRSGFRHGSTVHLELYYQENPAKRRDLPAWDRRTLVIVDEAAMLDTPTYARLMRRAAEARAKVVLVGDDRQLASVERGGMFSEIKERHGSAVIRSVRRQGEDWQRQASQDFAEGRVAEGLRAYAERGSVHWSGDLEESRARLLSDWDQDRSERPDAARFVYASTNREVNRLNRAIRDIRVRRGEVASGIEVETVRGRLEVGIGDRIQFHGNDRRAGIYNGALGTVERIAGTEIVARMDAGREVRFDSASFDQFGLGYAGTVYRGQGKTQLEVYALYDNAFAWNARTAYVGMTRHKASVNLYVSTDLAADEIALARQMGRVQREEASLAYATAAEVVELDKARSDRDGRDGRGGGEGKGAMQQPRDSRKKQAEETPLPEIAADDPDRAAKLTDAMEERRRTILGAEEEDRRANITADEEKRLAFVREAEQAEAARVTRMNDEAEAASRAEQQRLAEMRETQPQHHVRFVAARTADATLARRQMREAAPPPERDPARPADDARAETQRAQGQRAQPVPDDRAFPASAQLRYTEALARHYNPRDPYGSLAQASLAEAAAYQRERHQLDHAIATEPDPARRDMLSLRRDIEHADHMAQVHDRVAGLSRCIGGEAHERQAAAQAERAKDFREQAKDGRQQWEARGIDQPALYPPLDEKMRIRREETRMQQKHREAAGREQQRGRDAPGRETSPRNHAREAQTPPIRTPEQERQAMQRLDLPAHAEKAHGYRVEWADDARLRATLRRGEGKEAETLDASRDSSGAWSYRNARTLSDQGDIVKFEALRSRSTLGAAQDRLRPVLAEEERQRGDPLHRETPEPQRQQDRARQQRERDDDERER